MNHRPLGKDEETDAVTWNDRQVSATVYRGGLYEKGIDNLIETATVLKVYPTLLDAYDNLSEIKAYKKRYSDFDIVYGDYEDYVSTRRKVVMTKTDERLTQEEIDKLLAMIDH